MNAGVWSFCMGLDVGRLILAKSLNTHTEKQKIQFQGPPPSNSIFKGVWAWTDSGNCKMKFPQTPPEQQLVWQESCRSLRTSYSTAGIGTPAAGKSTLLTDCI